MTDLLVTGTVKWSEQRGEETLEVGPTGWALTFTGPEDDARAFATAEIARRYPRATAIDISDVEDLDEAVALGHPRKDR